MIRSLLLAVALALGGAAQAQTVTVTSPNTVDPAGRPRAVPDVFVRQPDGTIAGSGVAPVATPAAASSLTVRTGAGRLFGINVTTGAAAGYVMLFDATVAPADGAVTPLKCVPLAATTGIDLNYRTAPLAFSNGLVAVFSTSGCFSKTASATAFISGDAR